MNNLIVFKNFDPDFYTFNPNNNDSLLGRGSFGRVYVAILKEGLENLGLPKKIALKQQRWKVRNGHLEDPVWNPLLYPSGYEETERTMLDEGILNFECENMVKIFAVSNMEGRQDLYMEHCDMSLEDFMEGKQSIALDDLKHVARGVLAGLVHLHGLNIIHRDIKPANVLLKKTNESEELKDMTVKVGDYNIMKLSPEVETTPAQTSFPNLQFRAPEVLLKRSDGRVHYMASCDIWSFGASIYYILTRKYIVSKADIDKENLDDIIIERLQILNDESIQEFLENCLKKEQRNRMTAEDLLNQPFLALTL